MPEKNELCKKIPPYHKSICSFGSKGLKDYKTKLNTILSSVNKKLHQTSRKEKKLRNTKLQDP